MSKLKRIQVSFTQEQWVIINKLRGEFGNKDADIIRNIVITWLTEKSFVTHSLKNRIEKEE